VPAPPASGPAVPRRLSEADAIDIWIARWLRIRRKDLLIRLPAPLRRIAGVAAFAAAAALAVLLARPQDGPAVPLGVLVLLGACVLLIGGVSWVRLPWLRPPVAAVVALAACQFVPGPDLDAVLPAAAGLAVLAAVLTEEHHVLLARPVGRRRTGAGFEPSGSRSHRRA